MPENKGGVSQVLSPEFLLIAFIVMVVLGVLVLTFGVEVTDETRSQSIREQITDIREQRAIENPPPEPDDYVVYVASRNYGPVQLDELINWVRNGQVGRETLISKNGAVYKAAELFPELQSVLPPPPDPIELTPEWRTQHIDEEIPAHIEIDGLRPEMYYYDENGIARWADPVENYGS